MTREELNAKYCLADALSVIERIKTAKTPKALLEIAAWGKKNGYKFSPAEKAAFEAQKKVAGANAEKSFNKVFGGGVGKGMNSKCW